MLFISSFLDLYVCTYFGIIKNEIKRSIPNVTVLKKLITMSIENPKDAKLYNKNTLRTSIVFDENKLNRASCFSIWIERNPIVMKPKITIHLIIYKNSSIPVFDCERARIKSVINK